MGRRYSILNLICLGTAFQQAVLLKEGKNPTSSQVLRALMNRWVSWGGNPVELACDRGRRNRGVVAKYCGENNRQVRHAPLECPEDIGRVERHGGILKAMYKKVAVEVQPMGPDDVEKILNECCRVKNASTRVGGFSPAQWIFGSDPRAAASLMNEGWTDLGGLAGQTDPTSILALQNMASVEAKKAFVHLDTSKRIQRAMLRNARPITMTYSVGDLVSFRKDNNTGGKTQRSVVSRVIGHERDRDVWVLCENVPVLVSVHNLRPASEAEALAKSVLEGHPI